MKITCTKCGAIFNGREEHKICGLCRNNVTLIPKVEVIDVPEDIKFIDASPDDVVEEVTECKPKHKKHKKHKK